MEIKKKLKALEDHIRDESQHFAHGKYCAEEYFRSCLLLQSTTEGFMVSDGKVLFEHSGGVDGTLKSEVRVGSYDFDGMGTFSTGDVPIDDDYMSVRDLLWRMTWPAYLAAQEDYLENLQSRVESDRRQRVRSFSRVEPARFNGIVRRKADPRKTMWRRILKEESRYLNSCPWIIDSCMSYVIEDVVRVYADSEGSAIVQEDVFYLIRMMGHSIAPDGEPVTLQDRFFRKRMAEMPSRKQLRAAVRSLAQDLKDIISAPVEKTDSYPAMFDPDCTEVLAHEIIGHRTEGHRQEDDWTDGTFRKRIGDVIAPRFFNMVDDPTEVFWQGSSGRKMMNVGHYCYDDEGVPGSRVVLIQDGVYMNYLLSRRPVEGYDAPPNGHGRTDGEEEPVARMSNVVSFSSDPKSPEELRDILMRECIRQDYDYGLVFRGTTGGHTGTDEDFFRIFPAKVYRLYARDAVDPDTGQSFRRGDMQLVRGIEVSGTPLEVLNRMVAMGDDYAVWPGFCGAESGYVKVSGRAPSSVFSRIAVKRVSEKQFANPLPKPSLYLEG